MGQGWRRDRGGILYLIRLDQRTDGALSFDLITRLGITIDDVPRTIGWDSLKTLVRHADCTWAVWRALNPEYAKYTSDFGRAQLMVKMLDGMQDLGYLIAKAHVKSGASVKRPSYLDVPWRRTSDTRHFGSGAIPQGDFYDWYYRRNGDGA